MKRLEKQLKKQGASEPQHTNASEAVGGISAEGLTRRHTLHGHAHIKKTKVRIPIVCTKRWD